MKKRILALFLCILTVGAVALNGCTKQTEEQETVEPTGFYEAPVFEESGINIIENGTTEYTIVIPADADELTLTASNDLSGFWAASTGVLVPVVTDDTLVSDVSDGKYISLGNTTIFENHNITLDSDLGVSGYQLKRVGNTLLICAKDTKGVSCGVYDLLQFTVGFEIYAQDEIAYDKKDSVPLYNFDFKYIPSIQIRHYNAKDIASDRLYSQRSQLHNFCSDFITFCHTVITVFLPVEEYYDEHPDWYSTDSGGDQWQLCFTSEGARHEMVAKIKDLIIASPSGSLVQIGMEDNHNMCQCENCVAAYEKYGNYGAVQLEFTNQLAEEINPWLEANYPDRDFKFVFFAYATSEDAPAKFNESTGKYEPVSEYFRVVDHVAVMLAPITMCFDKPVQDPSNSSSYRNMQAWHDLFASAGKEENIVVYHYSMGAYAELFPFDNYGVIADTYKYYSEIGTSAIFDQGATYTRKAFMEALSSYIQSKLLYNCELDVSQLISDFMAHYFDVAGDTMNDYFNFVRANLQYHRENSGFSAKIFATLDDPTYWDIGTTNLMLDYIDRALTEIEVYKESDPTRYEQLHDRLMREKILPMYILMQYYSQFLTLEQKVQYIDDVSYYADKFGIVETSEGKVNLQSIIQSWRDGIQ